MPKQSTREQLADLAVYVVPKGPKWITSNQVMVWMDCGITKARNLSKALAECSDDFEYQNGDIRFIGNQKTWKASTLWEDL